MTKAAAVYLRHEVKLSYRDVQKVFAGLFAMPFVPTPAMAFSHQSAARGSEVAVSILASAFPGNLVADRVAAYNAIHPKTPQAGLAHLIRKSDPKREALNLSLLTTAKRQDRNPVDLFKTLLLRGQSTPLDALHDPRNLPTSNSP